MSEQQRSAQSKRANRVRTKDPSLCSWRSTTSYFAAPALVRFAEAGKEIAVRVGLAGARLVKMACIALSYVTVGPALLWSTVSKSGQGAAFLFLLAAITAAARTFYLVVRESVP
jgi:hypothetical protein